MIRPKFLLVRPADIERVGCDGACVLALMRYVTAEQMWWQASNVELGEALGLSRYSVGRTVRKLESAGLLLSRYQDGYAKAFRVHPDQALTELEHLEYQWGLS